MEENNQKKLLQQTFFWQWVLLVALGLIGLFAIPAWIALGNQLYEGNLSVVELIAYLVAGFGGIYWLVKTVTLLYNSAKATQQYRSKEQEADWILAQRYQQRFMKYVFLSPLIGIALLFFVFVAAALTGNTS
jgi:hypothetical protein